MSRHLDAENPARDATTAEDERRTLINPNALTPTEALIRECVRVLAGAMSDDYRRRAGR